jgi:hypothetical protein
MLYLRSQEPYWKCRALDSGGVINDEIEIWENLRCGSDPSLLPPDDN